jgi:hypothetical protein
MNARAADKPEALRASDAAVHRCANCGALAPDAFCPSCGQGTRERLPTFGQFMREATGRYVAYDGKFWKTLAALLFRPGFLTREYLAGRRRRYIGPARLFLVSSLVLFAALRLASEALDIDNAARVDPAVTPRTKIDSGDLVAVDDDLNVRFGVWPGITALLDKPIARFNRLSRAQKVEQILAGTLRYGPYAMFALLPAFALLLKLLYLGRRRRYPARPRLYGEHLVFAAHNHAFLFVAGTLLYVVPTGWVRGALALWAVVYLAWSMRAAYGGSWVGIAARAFVLLVAYSILLGLFMVGLLIAAVLLR